MDKKLVIIIISISIAFSLVVGFENYTKLKINEKAIAAGLEMCREKPDSHVSGKIWVKSCENYINSMRKNDK